MKDRVLYISSFDISLGKGPSVNERTFIKSLNNNDNYLSYYIHGRLTKPIDFTLSNSYSLIPSPQRHPLFLPIIELYKFLIAIYFILIKRINIIIVRVELFPISILLLSILFKHKIYIKTFGGGLMNSLKNRGYKTLNSINNKMFSLILKRSKGVDTVSERFRNQIINSFNLEKEKVFVVDNGVDLEMFKKEDEAKSYISNKYNLPLNNYDILLGYAGNLSHIRGGKEVVEAVNILSKEFPEKKVGGVICGGGISDEILKKEIEEMGVEDDIFLTGNVLFADMPYFISCLDIGFSILEKKYQGASAQKVRQYIACDVFTITTPGQEEFVEEYGIGKVFLYEEKEKINEYLVEILKEGNFNIKSPKELLQIIDIKSKIEDRIRNIKNIE